MASSKSVPLLSAAAAAGLTAAYVATSFVSSAPAVNTRGTSNNLRGEVFESATPSAEPRSGASSQVVLSAVATTACVAAIAKTASSKRARGSKQAVALRAFESELGVQAPVGFWDPLGFTADGDVAAFRRRRSVELKHGRIAMLATMGYITPELIGKFPGDLSPSAGLKYADIPNGLAAVAKVPTLGWLQILAYFGFVEFSGGFEDYKSGTPGDYGWKVLTSSDEAEKSKKLSAEIANGRLAMAAIIGMFFQDGLTGSAWGDWALYTASPLRAFESDVGVQAPFGFWDPLGLSKDGNPETFKRRRETEIKHGRVAMYATIGYIVPEYFRWPGDLSPSLGIKFTDVPNGLAAISKVPGNGWAQIVAFLGFYELNLYKFTGEPGNYGKGFLGISAPIADPEVRKRKLNAELANGRLAMAAVIGMFFQDGLTGSAWGDWALYTDSPLRGLDVSNEPGAQAPLGYWDPLGLSRDTTKFDYTRRREVELKHGRVAMFATIGYILPEYWRFPGFLSPSNGIKFTDIPNGLAAVKALPPLAWVQIIAFAGVVELFIYNENVNDEPGNYGAGFLGVRTVGIMNTGIADPEQRKKKLNAELANGRLAMMAIIGMFFQDGLTGSAWGDWSLYTASPLRAFENELGVQAPIGFWDPVGFTKDGDVAFFKKYREAELKHGRVSMLAAIGYIVPEYFKFPGFLSPKLGIQFSDIPNGLAAITKVPGGGWAQIVGFLGVYEVYVNKPVSDEPGNYGKGNLGLGFLGPVTDPEARKRKLSAELANGRLAMAAVIGMFFQDGLTGSAWGDWALYTDSPLRGLDVSNEPGAQAPLGYWDPLGLSRDTTKFDYTRRREVELKHGRVAMFATIGYILPEYWRFPGFLSPSNGIKFTDVPNGLAAVKALPPLAWVQIIAFAGVVELFIYNENVNDEPGNYGAGFLGVRTVGIMNTGIADPEQRKKKLNAELANGRLAMMAIIGMFFQDGLTGSAWGDWSLYTASPLRAFENELGVQSPVGFWDPIGFTADGDVTAFKRRRSVELKHGRIAMLATMGYFTPEITGKFPGYLSPSQDLKFADIPNGLAAISKVPALGWAQIFAYGGFVEYSAGFDKDVKNGTPGEYGWKVLTSSDPVKRTRKLNSELANGRLAMLAIMGMFFQNGVSGTTGPEMWFGRA